MVIMVWVAGIAIPSRIRNGMTVQTISTVVLWWNWAGRAPAERRNFQTE
jgi:hypothetical protein